MDKTKLSCCNLSKLLVLCEWNMVLGLFATVCMLSALASSLVTPSLVRDPIEEITAGYQSPGLLRHEMVLSSGVSDYGERMELEDGCLAR